MGKYLYLIIINLLIDNINMKTNYDYLDRYIKCNIDDYDNYIYI